jgi:hypothetical protein
MTMKLRLVSAAALLLLSGTVASVHADEQRRAYIVQLADKPAASYTGGIAGLAATQPAAGTKFNVQAQTVQLYSNYLEQKHSAVLSTVPSAQVVNDFTVVLNGFTVLLTDAEVRTLQANSAVTTITPDSERHLLTNYTPGFIGLDGPNGVWSHTVGGKAVTGEDVVIGIVDGGVWPENGSYADRVDGSNVPSFANSDPIVYTAPLNWHGTCQTGEAFTTAKCNNKLIGARYFKDGFDSANKTLHWSDFISPRDSLAGPSAHGGHGSHTSSTAGGNKGVQASLDNGNIAMGAVSGMAPRARIAVYKVCWTYVDPTATDGTGTRNSCFVSDSVNAIEQAVADGVNVINYSISGGGTVNDPVEQAFLHAANAGVFVSASAGNDGPAQAVAHISPWLTTVAAATHNRAFKATVTLGSGASYTGASLANTAIPAGTPMVRSADVGKAGADPEMVRLCFSDNGSHVGVLDPAKVTGKIVVCTRGNNARVDKSLAVKNAGGIGMVLADNDGGLVAEVHSVPTVHVKTSDGVAILAYAANAGATGAISHFVTDTSGTAPLIASFSSRGPNAADANVLKPDVAAPGVDILAAVTPELTEADKANLVNGTLQAPLAWALYQGTSMAAPHVAGVAALMHQMHPDWTPAMIKSALMTTATSTFPDGQPGLSLGTLPWSQGAGHINPNGTMPHPANGISYNPNGAIDPGLVYNAGETDYKKYMCGAGISASCSAGSIVGYNLNLPSITVGNVLGTITVNRSVTNVGPAATYTATASVPGFNVVVEPASLTLDSGATGNFTVKLSRNNAALNTWQYGALTWTDGSHIVRSPITARSGKPVTAPSLSTSTRATGNLLLNVTTGFAGRMALQSGGLKEVSKSPSTLIEDITVAADSAAQVQAACNAGGAGIRTFPVVVPANNVMIAVELFNSDTDHPGADDLDLALLNSGGTIVALSGHGGANESVIATSVPAGSYVACVVGYQTATGTTHFNLSTTVVSKGDLGGNLRVAAPSQVYEGASATVGASWSGLATGKRYYGGIQYLDGTGAVAATTILKVETNSPLPVAEPTERPTRNVGVQ